MDYNQSFSALNESLRPRFNTGNQIYSSLNRLEDRSPRATSIYYTSPTMTPTISTPAPPKYTVPGEDELDGGLTSDPPQLFEDNSTLLSEMGFKASGDDDDSSSTKSEEKDCPGELPANQTEEGPESPVATEGDVKGSILHKAFIDGTLPDLIKSGRPLSRRRTLGHVNDTLKEVRREVELSRRRSIRLKAQVDKLQESHEGGGWSQDRKRVTDEVVSILRFLHPLADPEAGPLKTPLGLDAALNQLQFVSRKLALDHTSQDKSKRRVEEAAILRQALRDRDEAIEKKMAMEAELLRSKTEMMALNNQLLEAVQKRLELSLELDAWKEDVQLMIQQQVQAQQQAEQAPKRTIRNMLRRNKQPPIQRPSHIRAHSPAPPATTNTNHIYVTRAASPSPPAPHQHQVSKLGPCTSSGGTLPRNWRLKKKSGRPEPEGGEDGFQSISLE
ncbi:bicaudal-D-related protein 2-like [Eucyclogobius newberryi]|uniref:bicaudal-D-related protein 2-like n=1 Tax=Eucyclogobius newberryi TaxID=166745 RepID=UPI003B58E4FC